MEVIAMKTKETMPAKNTALNEDLLPGALKIADLRELFEIAEGLYAKPRKRLSFLSKVDSGQIWSAINAKFPKYQIKPDTNHVNMTKENILASIYSNPKSAFLVPKRQEDLDVVAEINQAIQNIWSLVEAPYYTLLAGERASLGNIGITKVGWNSSIRKGTLGAQYKGDAALKNISPMKFMRDPFADRLENGTWACDWDDFPNSQLKRNKKYKAAYKKYNTGKNQSAISDSVVHDSTVSEFEGSKDTRAKYTRVVIWYYKCDGKMYELHLFNNEFVGYVKELDIDQFPYAILYCNIPSNDLIGISEPAKIVASSVASNVMLSIGATHVYKQHRPARFLNTTSGINVRSFATNGNDADKLWLTNSKAEDAVHYERPADLDPFIRVIPDQIDARIQKTSGISDAYKGQDTGSILTTGGVQDLMARATMIDAVKIRNYETYIKRLTELIISNIIKHAGKETRRFVKMDSITNQPSFVEVNFSGIKSAIKFGYDINVSADLPVNKARLSALADELLEKQGQYQMSPSFLTNEEYIMLKDIPTNVKTLMLERISIERNADVGKDVMQALTVFSQLIEQGLDPNMALEQTIQSLQQSKDPNTKLGNTAKAPGGTPQARQAR